MNLVYSLIIFLFSIMVAIALIVDKIDKDKKLHAEEWELNGLYEQNRKNQNWILYIIFTLVLMAVCQINVMINLDDIIFARIDGTNKVYVYFMIISAISILISAVLHNNGKKITSGFVLIPVSIIVPIFSYIINSMIYRI